ncbi:MAG: hypothetical protein SVZ03_09410 [Spirochaetota bacterium]|nr:hypothetical protein [Spirochaetota bacterium]
MNYKDIKNILTDDTIRAFEGDIGFIKFEMKKVYGPFYRIDFGDIAKEMINQKLEKKENDLFIEKLIKSKKTLKPNSEHLIKSRCKSLENIANSSQEPQKSLALSFLKTYKDIIEMDPKYNLLYQFKIIFSNQKDDEIDTIWENRSHGRWCGIEKPKNLIDAHQKYFIPQYITPIKEDDKKLYLFKFDFKLTKDKYIGAGLFFGKTYRGNALQFKYNNYAINCIENLQCLGIINEEKIFSV